MSKSVVMIVRRKIPVRFRYRAANSGAGSFSMLPWLLTVLLFVCDAAHAQIFSFRPYTPAEGLTNLAVGHLALGANGDLWVGTDGGLFRYDGTSFEPIDIDSGLPPEQVGGVQTDRWGGVWVNLVRGSYTRRPGSGRFEILRAEAGPVHVDFRTPVAFLDPNDVLVLSAGHVIELHRAGNRWVSRPYFTSEQSARLGRVRRMLLAADGTLWLSCGTQICSVDKTNLRVWQLTDGVDADDWNSFLEDRAGRVWVRSPQHLLIHERNASSFAARDPPMAELAEIRDNLAMTLDPTGRVLVRTGSGLARWDDTQWKLFTFANGLPAASISDALLDSEGNIWLGMNGMGVWRWRNYDHLESWTQAQGLVSGKIWSLLRDPQHRLLLGTSNGCQMLDEQAGHVVGCPVAGLPQRALRSMAVDSAKTIWWGFNNGEIWASTAGEARAHLIFPASADRPEISQMYFDQSGLGWVAALDGGLFQLDPGIRRLEKVELHGAQPRIYDITEDSLGRLWVAGSTGLFRKDADEWTLVESRDPAGTPSVFGSVAATPDGSVWGASDGRGLLAVAGSTFEHRAWVQADIVAHTSVYFARQDTRGWLWLGTGQGVIVFDGKLWRRIDQEDGLVWNDTQVYGFLADGDGSVWIGTSAGLTHVRDPQHLMSPPQPLDLAIARARLGTQSLVSDNSTTLPWRSDAAFDVHLGSHSYSRSAQTEFRYRLIGLSSTWFGSRSPEIHVPALDAGKYRLEVMAVDTPHARVSRILSLAFKVLPPWWRTLAFRSAIAVVIVLAIASAWRWQIVKFRARRRALEAEFKERKALLERATRDALTGLWNRATIMDLLGRESTQAHRNGSVLSVGMIDVDHFKLINDNYGHPGGDEVLRELARRLRMQLRDGDSLGRYGGEELMLVLPGRGREAAEGIAERLRSSVADGPFILKGEPVTVTISIGVTSCETSHDQPDHIVARADAALYEAKRSGRNRVVYTATGSAGESHSLDSRRYLRALLDKLDVEFDQHYKGEPGGD
jgi:diguanylate cyclase (GGDEF)-like protein